MPDYLKCAITDDLMDEPVVIQSGFTYEKKMILLHFSNGNRFCPISRQDVDPNYMIPNHNIRKATEDFLAKNPWAF